MFLWCCGCVFVFSWFCFCGGVVVFLGGVVFVIVSLWWCGCVFVFSWLFFFSTEGHQSAVFKANFMQFSKLI